MQDLPESKDILEAVTRWLRDEAMPLLPPHAAFQARVAANALNLVRRELSQPATVQAAKLDCLRALTAEDGSLDVLTARLAAGIADGSLTADTPGLLAHLWNTTLDKMAVDQPTYAAYQRELATAPNAEQE